MNVKIKYTEGPIGDIRIVADSLPPPEELAIRDSTTTVSTQPLAKSIEYTHDALVVLLVDGRKISVPIIWFPRLEGATRKQLDNSVILGNGEGIHWPELDEDLSVAGLLRGTHENA